MSFVLSSSNVVEFLQQHHLCTPDFQPTAPISCLDGTNFNLVVESSEGSFLVKQNRLDSQGQTQATPVAEWVVQALIDTFGLIKMQPLVSRVLLLDSANHTLVSVFFDRFQALNRFYDRYRVFPAAIAERMGKNLAVIHRSTFARVAQQEFVARHLNSDRARVPGFVQRLNNLYPHIFATIPTDGLEFYRLYQRFPSLNQAVLKLYSEVRSSCLIHNDLTLDNFILDRQLNPDSAQIEPQQIKIIDWERTKWGDPAIDLGMVLAEYVGGIWLGNLVVDPHLDLNTILSLAAYPLEMLIPSLRRFVCGYLSEFPEIVTHRPDFLQKVVQFAGIGILDRLTYYVEHHYQFDNNSLCKLQVAKNLICAPQQGITTLFGMSEAELIATNVVATT